MGVELDGVRAAAVQVVGDVVAAARSVEGTSAADALTKALAGIPAGAHVYVTVASEAQVTARLNLTAPPATRSELVDALDAHSRTVGGLNSALLSPDVTTAATFTPPSGVGLRWAGLVLGWPAALVRHVHTVAAQSAPGRTHVLPTPVVNAGGGQLVLALRETNCELTLSHDGAPVATQHLSSGGLGVVEAVLGSGDRVGEERTTEALERGGVRDPLAAAELDRWLRGVLDEVAATVAVWRDGGLAVPDTVFLYGRASSAVALDLLLDDYGMRRCMTPPHIARALLKVPTGRRHLFVGAYLAATAGVGAGAPLGELAAFDDPDGRAARVQAARRARRVRVLRSAALAAALAVAVTAGPRGLVELTDAVIEHRTSTIEQELTASLGLAAPSDAHRLATALAHEDALTGAVAPGALSAVLAAAPPGLAIESATVRAERGGTLVTIATTVPAAGTADVVRTWEATGFHVSHVQTGPSPLPESVVLTIGVWL